MKGIKRFRQAIKNQRDLGNGDFSLTYHDAEEIAVEIEKEYGWAAGVPAPRDADGEVVPLDTEVLYREDGGKCKVAYWAYYPNEKDSWTAVSDVMGTKRACIPKTLHLTSPDSWEKLEEDVQKVKETGDICGYYDKVGKPCNGCPARNIPGVCSATVLRDALRRSKALAGRGED